MRLWLNGYYPPRMYNFLAWESDWSMGPHAEDDWIWFDAGDYTEREARHQLKVGKSKRDLKDTS